MSNLDALFALPVGTTHITRDIDVSNVMIKTSNEAVTSAACTVTIKGKPYDVAVIYDVVQDKAHVSTFGLGAPPEVLSAAEIWIKGLHTKNVGESPTKEIS